MQGYEALGFPFVIILESFLNILLRYPSPAFNENRTFCTKFEGFRFLKQCIYMLPGTSQLFHEFTAMIHCR